MRFASRMLTVAAEGEGLHLALLARTTEGALEEQGPLSFVMPFDAEQPFPSPGNYRVEGATSGLQGGIAYRSQQGTRTSAHYQFEGFSLRLQIEQARADLLSGRFSLSAVQTAGERMQDGQREEVQLARDGEVEAQGIFYITDVRVETH